MHPELKKILLSQTPQGIVDPLDDEEVEALSPRIRDLVVALRAAGFETTDSGDGTNLENGMGGALAIRHVAIHGDFRTLFAETQRLAAWCMANELDWPAYRIECSWSPTERSPMIMLTESSEQELDDVEAAVGWRPSGLY